MLRTSAPLIGALGLTNMRGSDSLIALLALAGAAQADVTIAPDLGAHANASQITALIQELATRYRREVRSVAYSACYSAPSCSEAAIITFEPDKEGSHAYHFYSTYAYLKTWDQEHPIASSESEIDLGDWRTSKALDEYTQFSYELASGERLITVRGGVSYDELKAIMIGIDTKSCLTQFLPGNKRAIRMMSEKDGRILKRIDAGPRLADVHAVFKTKTPDGDVYRLDVNPPESNFEYWDFTIRSGKCVLVGYTPYFI